MSLQNILYISSLLAIIGNTTSCYNPAPMQRSVDETLIEAEIVDSEIYAAPKQERTKPGAVTWDFYPTPERRVVQPNVWELQGSQKAIAPLLPEAYCPEGNISYKRHPFETDWVVYFCDIDGERTGIMKREELPFDPDTLPAQ